MADRNRTRNGVPYDREPTTIIDRVAHGIDPCQPVAKHEQFAALLTVLWMNTGDDQYLRDVERFVGDRVSLRYVMEVIRFVRATTPQSRSIETELEIIKHINNFHDSYSWIEGNHTDDATAN